MSQVFCDWVFVNGPKKGTLCKKRVKKEGKTKCWAHCPERKEQAAKYRKEFYEKNREYELSCCKKYRDEKKRRIKEQKIERCANDAIKLNNGD